MNFKCLPRELKLFFRLGRSLSNFLSPCFARELSLRYTLHAIVSVLRLTMGFVGVCERAEQKKKTHTHTKNANRNIRAMTCVFTYHSWWKCCMNAAIDLLTSFLVFSYTPSTLPLPFVTFLFMLFSSKLSKEQKKTREKLCSAAVDVAVIWYVFECSILQERKYTLNDFSLPFFSRMWNYFLLLLFIFAPFFRIISYS